ncbi:MAG: divergent polysaccharide deacetylase family protein [Gammaproteobacteria bacterium]|nr:divergent polysaccharide deacetylase family protein [Gammaproteobacteria bacterium]
MKIKSRLVNRGLTCFYFWLIVFLILPITAFSSPINKTSYIAIIIDDLGYKPQNDRRALALKGNLSYAFLPFAPNSKVLAKQVVKKQQNIFLHLPMEATNSVKLGPGGLTYKMTKSEFTNSVINSINSVPYIIGINNHMGSLLTTSNIHMQWLMEIMSQKNLIFIDSRTTTKTVAEKLARQNHIQVTRRNVFLDHTRNAKDIQFQYNRLLKLAKRNKTALAIAHPFPETLTFLEQQLPKLKSLGIELVSVSELIKQQQL